MRREYRRQIIDAVRANEGWELPNDSVTAGNESGYFSCKIGYGAIFQPAEALRPHLKLELTFCVPALVPETRALSSFVAQARRSDPEVSGVACVVPVETAAEKLSALAWRVLARRRGERYDPALIRHLHDLAALEPVAVSHKEFPKLLVSLLNEDVHRGNPSTEFRAMSAADMVKQALDLLANDPVYSEEYRHFVLGMSYAAEGGTPSFEEALVSARQLARALQCTTA